MKKLWLYATSTDGKLVGATVKTQHEDLIDNKRFMGFITARDENKA